MGLKLVRASAVTAVGCSIGECSENESTTHRNQLTGRLVRGTSALSRDAYIHL